MSIISVGTTLTSGLVLTSDTNGNLIIKTGAGAITAATFEASGSLNVSGALVAASAAITTLSGTSANITTITEAGSPVVVQTDIGSAPNQIPLNQYLGSMAYQSSVAVSVTNLVADSITLTNALKTAEGGTGLDSTPTNGQLLIGNGAGFTLATLTAGSGMTITNGTGTITLAAGGLPPVTVSNTTTISAVAGNHYVLTAASLTTVTLPASPTISDTVWVTVANGLTTNVVARNGKNIQGIAEDMTLNSAYAAAQMRFSDNTEGWILI
jgi:hypothetical protein